MAPEKKTPLLKRFRWKGLAKAEETDLAAYRKPTVLKCTVAYNKYGGYCVPRASRRRPAARAILSGKVWESETIAFMIASCADGDVVHAGAFFGDFLPALSKGVAPNATVWAFEPNLESYRCARITLEINDLNNVVLSNAGLGAKRGTLFLQTRDRNDRALGGASRVIAGETSEAVRGEETQIRTIDETVGKRRKVSIIQLDVEGYEKEALSGGLRTIRKWRPILIFEIRPTSALPDSKWFAERILELGYRRIENVHSNAVFVAAVSFPRA